MLFRTHKPAAPLSQFVEMFWFYSGNDVPHRRERVLPDGSVELVINFDDVPRKRFNCDDPRRFETVRRAWIAGPQPGFILIDVLPNATMMGVHFKPGGLSPFVTAPASEFCGGLVELNAFWGSAADDLRDELLEIPDLPERFARLECFLVGQAVGSLRADPFLSATFRLLDTEDAMPSLRQTAEHLGVSHKHFIERFRAVVGLNPKRFARIRRFQRALKDARTRTECDWSDLAARCGYYDQAHFIHDFRAFSGLTPTSYMNQSGADDRFVPISD